MPARTASSARKPDCNSLCGCASNAGSRKAAGVDPDIKQANIKRLRRIEGQIRGIQRMVEEERYCADILEQIASAHEALRGVQRSLMRNHLEHCVTRALREGSAEEAQGIYDELMRLTYRNLR